MEYLTLEMLGNEWVHIWEKVVEEIDDVSVNDAFVPTEKHMMNCVVLELKRKIRDEADRWGRNYGKFYVREYFLPTASVVRNTGIIRKFGCEWFIRDEKNYRRGVASEITMKVLKTSYANQVIYNKELLEVEADTMCEKWITKDKFNREETNQNKIGQYEKLMTGKIDVLGRCDTYWKEQKKEIRKGLKDAGIKIWCKKIEMGRLNLKGRVYGYYDAINLKHWDKITGKTSNKGLKAETSYTYTDKDNRGGWTFGGIKAGDLCGVMKRNGIETKGLMYGDMAEKLMKLD
jgi:hypothetical protein